MIKNCLDTNSVGAVPLCLSVFLAARCLKIGLALKSALLKGTPQGRTGLNRAAAVAAAVVAVINILLILVMVR